MKRDYILNYIEGENYSKQLDREVVFSLLEQAIVSATRKHFPEDSDIIVHIDRQTGEVTAFHDDIPIVPEEISDRIVAQTAKQIFSQKLKELERDTRFEEYKAQLGQIVSGQIRKFDSSALVVDLPGGVEGILPRGERIPGENFQPNDRVSAQVLEVKKNGVRVKVILSRIRPLFLQRLLEQEIPEIADNYIEIKAVSREPGHRAKVAVYCSDPRIDSVGACVGPRGSRIRQIGEEIRNERVDVIPWTSDVVEYIKMALQPAHIDDVILCGMLGRAIALVQKDQRSLAIGRRGVNVRLASRLCGWDIEIMTQEEIEDLLEKARSQFTSIPGVSEELADQLTGEGFLSYDDLSIIEPSDLMEIGGLTEEEALQITEIAEERAEEEEKEKEERARQEAEARKEAEQADKEAEQAMRDSLLHGPLNPQQPADPSQESAVATPPESGAESTPTEGTETPSSDEGSKEEETGNA